MASYDKRVMSFYYLGYSTTTPAFSTQNKIIDYIFEFDIYSLNEIANNLTIGQFTGPQTVTLNQAGMSINNTRPFANNLFFGFTNNIGYNPSGLNSLLASLSTLFYDVTNNYPLPDGTNKTYFAVTSENYYMILRMDRATSYPNYGYDLYPIMMCDMNGNVISSNPSNLLAIPLLRNAFSYYNYGSGSQNVYTTRFQLYKPIKFEDGEYGKMNIIADYTSVNGTANPSRFAYYANKFSQNQQFNTTFLEDLPIYQPPDPYDDYDDSSEAEGGTGDFDTTSNLINPPSIPSTTVTGTGFVRIYNPSLSQLQSLSQYMWTNQNFIDTIVNLGKKMLENPMEAIISLNLLPCPIPNAASEEVKVMFIPTGVHMPPATTQFVEVDCGYYDVKEFYGSALDYSPHTKIQCYLPYIGQVPLDTDEVMGKRVSIKYRIDIVTGMCVALISVDGSVMYQHTGHCAIAMPLTSGDFSGYVSAALGVAKAAGGLVAAAAGAPQLASAALDLPMPTTNTSYTKTTNTARNEKTGRQITKGTTVTEHIEPRGPSFGEMMKAGISNSVGAVMGAKATVERSGGFSGNSGYLAVKRPYLIIQVPRMCLPENYGKFRGYPSMINVLLSNCSGYTEVQEIHLQNVHATNPEMSEIVALLKGGVVF